MKAGIHPEYHRVTVTCACGNTFETGSTHPGPIRVEICSQCHPYYTGTRQRTVRGGRVERFQRRYGQKAQA
ncbi:MULTISPECIES: 50S ribosomal protein L31 [Limnochorda]|uniref:50S ribosomal protein L31 n=1 Tax=Limnochorda TaxID=1676651 RepID=UPI0017E4DE66|nr:50S ribosomal protein L31 [Limnochorda pilosa]MBO2485834.1 50S ribosomal protein L31 [Bacillota bacterium]MBO2519228.1 50S ribosomal protein L31 [Bacillota bacterium]NMA71679.1 50S ribosomal protein L31 [Bacillota bacterium]